MCVSEWEDGRMSRRTGGGLGRGGRTSDPLAVHIVPRLPRKSSCPTPATQKRRSPKDTRGTPGRTSDPWQCTLSHACHAKAAEPKGQQRDAPWQCTLSHACHEKAAEPKGHQRDARGTPEGRQRDQGVHPTPWLCILSHACHAKAAE